MDPRFNDIAGAPENQIFQVVFFPDRIYHAQYLNATRSMRYRYNVREVRGKADINVLKGEVYLDGIKLCNFLRLEYRGARLVEVARERGRFLGNSLLAQASVYTETGFKAEAQVRLHLCPWIDAFQVEIWETLEPPAGKRHDFQVLDMMGSGGSITRVPQFAEALRDPSKLKWVNVSFRENDIYHPNGFFVPPDQASWDNFYERNVQVPISSEPSSSANTIKESSYGVTFQRGWFIRQLGDIPPVRYRNAMMNDDAEGRRHDNITDMRWALQQEFGGSVVFFHEVTIAPGTIEGTHQHIGSEELYYITSGRGVAYMGENDDPAIANQYPTVQRDIFGIGPKPCKKVDVEPGSVIFTKSGGIHGIENPYSEPLKFVAFLYHSA